jgi:hypothetical protein
VSTPPDESVRVPLFGTWRNAYVSVVVFFLIDVALFYLFQSYFS